MSGGTFPITIVDTELTELALLDSPELQFIDADGHPYASGTLGTFIADSMTPKDTWLDPDAVTLNTNPIVLDSAGRCVVWGDGLYRVILKDVDGNTIFDKPSTTLVSRAMVPVVGAATLADARDAMGITALLDAEATARANADAAELARAEAAEATLGAGIAAEITRAEGAEASLAAGIAAETARAEAAEAALSALLHTIQCGIATPSSGHVRVTFGTPFATPPAIFLNVQTAGIARGACYGAVSDVNGCDIFEVSAGTLIPGNVPIYWLAIEMS
jgi:hypothetical protein